MPYPDGDFEPTVSEYDSYDGPTNSMEAHHFPSKSTGMEKIRQIYQKQKQEKEARLKAEKEARLKEFASVLHDFLSKNFPTSEKLESCARKEKQEFIVAKINGNRECTINEVSYPLDDIIDFYDNDIYIVNIPGPKFYVQPLFGKENVISVHFDYIVEYLSNCYADSCGKPTMHNKYLRYYWGSP